LSSLSTRENIFIYTGCGKKTDPFSSAHRSAAERPGEVGIALLQRQHDAILYSQWGSGRLSKGRLLLQHILKVITTHYSGAVSCKFSVRST
jgi:hypothetical protein